MSVSPLSRPQPGSTVTHTVRVTNLGQEDTTNAVVDVSFTSGFSVTGHTADPGTTYANTEWAVGSIGANQTKTLVVTGTFNDPYTATAKAHGSDNPDGNPSNYTATWYSDPNASGNPVPVAQIPPGSFYCIVGDDDGSSGYETTNGVCIGDPTLVGAGQADVAVTVWTPRATTVPAGHVLMFYVGVEKLNTNATYTGIRVAVPVPSGTRLIRAETTGRFGSAGTGGSYNASSGIWNVGALNNTRNKSLILVLETTGSGPVTLSAQLTHVDQPQATVGNDSASATAFTPIAARPANDDIAAAVDLTGPSGRVVGTTVGATAERFEGAGIASPPGTSVNRNGLDRASVWYRWRAPATGVLTIHAPASRSYGPVDLFEGPPSALRSIALGVAGNDVWGRA